MKKKEKSEYEKRKEMNVWERRKAVIDEYWPDKIMYKRNVWKEELEIWVYVDYLWIWMKQSLD